jgi:hypothetical protein
MSPEQMKFVDFLVSLAPEGETALLVKQKPVKLNGALQYHDDGAIKCTWPSFLPSSANIKEGESWFGNTASFILDRFENGRVSASKDNCDYVLVMMLDDVGSDKTTKTPTLEPTWIMETSEGSFQWAYVFSDQPGKNEFSAAITAIAAAGYSDPGACNAVRNFRIPGSVNIKDGKGLWKSRLVSFKPEREFSCGQICAALGVVPAEADTATRRAVRVEDTGSSPVLKWLSDQSLVCSALRPTGWIDIVCPNHAAHTDGSEIAGFRPVDSVFKCLHGHCVDFNSAAFLGWVSDNGGPSADSGIRPDIMADLHAKTLDKLRPTDAFPDDAAKRIAEIERKQIGRAQKSDWFDRFAYVMSDDSYFDVNLRREISRSNFNAVFRHIPCKSIHNGRRVEASVCYDESRDAHDAKILTGVTYAPGDGLMLERDGEVFGNRWIDARPVIDLSVKISDDQVQRWLDHCKVLMPEGEELNHCLDVMAYKVQHANSKINHAILHGGDEGCGKDTMWKPFVWAVAGPHNRNRSVVDSDGLHSQWGYNLEAEVMILNELKEPDASARRALANKLKPVIAAPPETLQINRKGMHPYEMINRVFVLAFTNDSVPISLPTQDRRWFATWSRAPRMNPEAATAMWEWYETGGGYELIAAWLWQRDVRAFNPAAPPMETDYKRTLIEQSMSLTESALVEMIRDRVGEFGPGVVGSPFHRLIDRLEGSMPSGQKIYPNTLQHALKEAGWLDMGRLASGEYNTKKQVWAAPQIAKRNSKSDLRRMIENGWTTPS